MTLKNGLKSRSFNELELALLRQEIEILKQEQRIEKDNLLKDIAKKLTARNMAFPVIREIIDLPEEELQGIFYGPGSKGPS